MNWHSVCGLSYMKPVLLWKSVLYWTNGNPSSLFDWLIDWLIESSTKSKQIKLKLLQLVLKKYRIAKKNKNTEKSYREHIYKTLLELIRSYNKKCHHDVRKEKEKSCHFKSTQKLINIYYTIINEHISNIPRYNKIRKPTSLEKKKKEKVTPTIPILKQYNPSQIKP